jgi:hypothetical protein
VVDVAALWLVSAMRICKAGLGVRFPRLHSYFHEPRQEDVPDLVVGYRRRVIRLSSARRPGAATAAMWLSYGIATAMVVVLAGVVYDLANFSRWAHTVGDRLHVPSSQILSDVSANTHLDVEVAIFVVVLAGLFLRGAVLIRHRSRPVVTYGLMLIFPIGLVFGILSSSESSLSRLDQAIDGFEPRWASVGPTVAMEVAALLSIIGLILAMSPSSRRWYGPSTLTRIARYTRRLDSIQPTNQAAHSPISLTTIEADNG